MKLGQRIMALAAAICLLVMMVPLTGRAAGEIRSKTLRVLCDGQAVSGASITVELRSTNGDRTLLGTSNSGELTLSSDMSDTEGKMVEVTITLPDGYEFAHAPADQKVLNIGYEPEGFFNNDIGLWNALRSKQGEALLLSMNHMDMAVGSSIDISGVFQDSFLGSSIQLYFQAQDGTKTQVACDRLVEENNPVYTKSSENPNLLRMTRAGTSKLTFYYGEHEATLTIVVENTNTQLPPDYNESRDVFRYSVIHNGKIVREAKIRLLLENDEDSIVWLTSDTGEIEFSRSSEELKNFNCLTIETTLPEGYQFLSYGIMENKISMSYDMQSILNGSADYSNTSCEVANPAVDGTLQIPETYLRAKIGDVIDLSGAFDLNAEEFPMYFIAPDGTRSRVVCDDYFANFQDNPGYRMDGYKLTITDYGLSVIIFYYKNSMAVLEIDVPDPAAPPVYIEISDNEVICIYPDGSESRIIFADDDTYFASIEGNKDQLLTGSRFENKAVTAGDIYNKAKEAIKKNFNTENLRVFEMNLWDVAGEAIRQLPAMMEIGLLLPEDFWLADGKQLMVYRLEDNGNLTRCNTSLKSGKVTFQTNHFSTYILAEVNENAVEPNQNIINTDSAMRSPKTADTTSSAGWRVVMAFAVLALAFINLKHLVKEKYRHEK